MGRYGGRVGQYWINFHESELGRQTRTKDLSRFQKRKVSIIFGSDSSSEEEVVKLPLSLVMPIVKTGEWYEWHWENFSTLNILWNVLKLKKINIILLSPSIYSGGENGTLYYLRSKIGDSEIVLSNKVNHYHVRTLKQLQWLVNKGFRI